MQSGTPRRPSLHSAAAMAHDFVTLVSGLPRSGTSMMMKMLEAGGMPVLVDHMRTADEDNPEGYYEFERVKKIRDRQRLAGRGAWPGRQDDLRAAATPAPDAPLQGGLHARTLAEVLASQRQMLIPSRQAHRRDQRREDGRVLSPPTSGASRREARRAAERGRPSTSATTTDAGPGVALRPHRGVPRLPSTSAWRRWPPAPSPPATLAARAPVSRPSARPAVPATLVAVLCIPGRVRL